MQALSAEFNEAFLIIIVIKAFLTFQSSKSRHILEKHHLFIHHLYKLVFF
ncbi:hypothetical protein MGSAQ_001116 [marine sediment metagenome]|uniref:Uncharacterized protein n=1 Tax=marine sediment metagenome TaxID=412755 RepID=A0A1B6NXE3_9ZZZZ